MTSEYIKNTYSVSQCISQGVLQVAQMVDFRTYVLKEELSDISSLRLYVN